MKRFSYSSLLRQRIIVAGLTLGLVTVMIGITIDLTVTGQKTTIPATTQKLIQPLNPQLDLRVIERLEQYQFVGLDQARQGVRLPGPALQPTPVPNPGETVPETVPENSTTLDSLPVDPNTGQPSIFLTVTPEPNVNTPPGEEIGTQ